MTAAAVSEAKDAVRKTLTVEAPREVAFRVFTAGVGTWWPKESHKIGAAAAVDVVIEPRAGGRWYERGADGKDTPWGEVVAWEPPSRLLLSWRIGADWAFHPELRTEVEVTFVAEGKARTRVELEHRGLSAYGEKADEMRAAFDSPDGWGAILATYAEAAAAA
jgi:uncharacterized protein YndB with AHSA1/START domain